MIPDISALASPGERAECRREASQRNNSAGYDGVRGLRALGVRDLSYRLAFIANSVQVGGMVYHAALLLQLFYGSCCDLFL